jgi:hypothetical protein
LNGIERREIERHGQGPTIVRMIELLISANYAGARAERCFGSLDRRHG